MESVLIISPLNLLPISSANFDFPVPVAPSIKITGTRKGAFMEAAIFEKLNNETGAAKIRNLHINSYYNLFVRLDFSVSMFMIR